jgi:pimeloyl-ACP methyl ester carboxylesterase
VRLPAVVPITHPSYGGSILINPGGPGGSGVAIVSAAGAQLQSIVDSAGKSPHLIREGRSPKHFDIVGFDPRGVGFTTPGAHCWEELSARESWTLRASAQGIPGSSDSAPGRLWSMAQAFGSSCASTVEEEHDIKQFLSTASVARDMLELTEALGEWRESRATTELLEQGMPQKRGVTVPPAGAIPGHLQYRRGEEKLLYWGFSYGTYLGSTFASMYPDRVGRMILDGVVDAPDYYKGLWTDNLRDTERVVEAFYEYCVAAREGCPLMEDGFTTEEVKERVHAIIQSLYHKPLPIPGPIPEVVTYSDVKLFIFVSLYAPNFMFRGLAIILKAIEDGDGAFFRPFLIPQHSYSCTSPNGTETSPVDGESQVSIICSDGDPQDFLNVTLFNEHWHHLEQLSPTGGGVWSLIRLHCSGWQIKALHRFRGPFGGNTSHPILWIGNTADPVTPVWG